MHLAVGKKFSLSFPKTRSGEKALMVWSVCALVVQALFWGRRPGFFPPQLLTGCVSLGRSLTIPEPWSPQWMGVRIM